jgi:hypothetical protein
MECGEPQLGVHHHEYSAFVVQYEVEYDDRPSENGTYIVYAISPDKAMEAFDKQEADSLYPDYEGALDITANAVWHN